MSTLPLPDDTQSDFLRIDEFALDREWLGQSELYYQHAAKAARAQRTLDTCKSELDVIKAEVDEKIRAAPDKYGIAKVTEGNISAAVSRHAKVIAATENMNAARYRASIRQAALTALEHRKRALTMLVTLHESNYFADPRISAGRAAREKLEQKAQAASARKTQLRREDSDKED